MGVLRLILALSVIATHTKSTVLGQTGLDGTYAVNFFFIISGFYMAMILNEKYAAVPTIVFYKSRLLRIFPTYYIGLIFCILIFFESIQDRFLLFTFFQKSFFILQNLFIVGHDLSYVLLNQTPDGTTLPAQLFTINPPAWSLAPELYFYLIAPFVVRTRKMTFIYFMAGILYLSLLTFPSLPIKQTCFARELTHDSLTYIFYASSIVFFASGALAYHFYKKPDTREIYFYILIIILAFPFPTQMPIFHMGVATFALPILFNYTANNRMDRFIGELSYPVYIFHSPIISICKPLKESSPYFFSFLSYGTWVAIFSCLMAVFVHFFIEKKFNTYRHSSKFLNPETTTNPGGTLKYTLLTLYAIPPILLSSYVLWQLTVRKHFLGTIPLLLLD